MAYGKSRGKKLSTKQTVLAIVTALVVLIASQSVALFIGNLPVMIGAPVAVGNLLAGVLYAALALWGISMLCKKIINLSLADCRLTGFSLKPVWVITAVAMPALVSGVLLLTAGHWQNTPMQPAAVWAIATGAIFFFGLATGIVEEAVFRGVIMAALERRCGRTVAILVPSVLFGLLHLIGNKLDFISTLQLLVAGSVVGVLFSLISYESGNIWNGALVHGVWNMAIIGGILHIGPTEDEASVFNYVIETKSFWLTGGDFGIEASVVSIAAYLIVALLALWLIGRKRNYPR